MDKYMMLAEFIMFTSGITAERIANKMDELGFEYRKGKGIKDILKAVQKARDPKNGHYRTEMELDMFRLYIEKDIVKIRRG